MPCTKLDPKITMCPLPIAQFTAIHDSSHRPDCRRPRLTAIPHASRTEVARNCKTDQLGTDIDVVVYGEFDNETELAAYRAHDLYREAT